VFSSFFDVVAAFKIDDITRSDITKVYAYVLQRYQGKPAQRLQVLQKLVNNCCQYTLTGLFAL
jgi:hypothetical protein